MRKIAFYLFALATFVACNRPASITIKFEGLDNPLVKFQYKLNDSLHIDSMLVENGLLHKEIAIKEHTRVGINPNQYLINGSMVGADLDLYVKPNDKITLNVECKDGYMLVDVEGSKLYKEYYSVINQCAPHRAEKYKWDVKSWKAISDNDIKAWSELNAKASDEEKKSFAIIKEYVAANPSSETVVLLFDWLSSFNDKTEIYKIMDKSLFKGAYKEIEDYYLKIIKDTEERRAKELADEEAKREQEETQMVGDLAPDFTLNQPNGKPFTLSSLRGKWVVMDFWATWCSPCKASMPHLKEYYKKYAGKLEIVGIVNASKEEDWKKMVKDMDLKWINVINPQENTANKDLTNIYGITAFPTYIILTPEGKIHKKVIGAREDLYNELDKILE